MRWHLALGLAAISLLSAQGAAQADPRTDAANAVLNCAALTDDAARLSCYDGAAGRLKEAMAPPSRDKLIADFGAPASARTQEPAPAIAPAPGQTQTAAAPAAPAGEESEDDVSLFGMTIIRGAKTETEFGEEQIERDVEGNLQQITVLVTDFAYTPTGDAVVFLENGQIWRQTDGGKVRFPNNPSDRRVTIKTASVGGYTMTVGDSNRSYRVRRAK